MLIVDSDKTSEQTAPVNLGEVVALKKFAHPADFFRKTVDQGKIVDISDEGPGPAKIFINHLILTKQINKDRKRFNEEEYVLRLNCSVAKGLLCIAAREKTTPVVAQIEIRCILDFADMIEVPFSLNIPCGNIYNPFRHLESFLTGNLYMARHYKRIVTLDK